MTATLTPLAVETTVGNHFISNYPPFSCWTAEVLPRLRETLDHPADVAEPLSLYVHIPFCRRRCLYCYFGVQAGCGGEVVDRYIDALLAEQALYERFSAIQGRDFRTVYFGGGTPSYLSTAQIRRLMDGLRGERDWGALEEFTVECEPGTVSDEKLAALKELGVTRLSLGFQTLHDDLLRRAGRALTRADCLEAYGLARRAGFDQINVDLLAGLPGETRESWRETVRRVIDLAPDCVTVYQLELTHNSGFYRSMQAGRRLDLADWPAKRAWTRETFETLEGVGYTTVSGYMAVRDPARWRFAYTVDHFWRGADLLALGETAFGHLQGVHYQNVKGFADYLAQVGDGRLPWRRAYRLSAEERLRRELILQLKTGGVDAAYFRQRFGVELRTHFADEFDTLEQAGLIRGQGDTIRLTREALLEVDALLPMFYLREHRGVRYT